MESSNPEELALEDVELDVDILLRFPRSGTLVFFSVMSSVLGSSKSLVTDSPSCSVSTLDSLTMAPRDSRAKISSSSEEITSVSMGRRLGLISGAVLTGTTGDSSGTFVTESVMFVNLKERIHSVFNIGKNERLDLWVDNLSDDGINTRVQNAQAEICAL
ncbi:hypothetical protein E2C01_005995 [Portunus trituberculatus]|uniref:Uncharacterized protein n=1 Tax=Portunus trituberculatus TaxID=210409 RepID=A0A5B7CTU2_PORTR|nr:hypothetical protein [Portunus trituberculatus]